MVFVRDGGFNVEHGAGDVDGLGGGVGQGEARHVEHVVDIAKAFELWQRADFEALRKRKKEEKEWWVGEIEQSKKARVATGVES